MYFNISPMATIVVKAMAAIGFRRVSFEEIRYHLSELRSASGESIYIRMLDEDVINIVNGIDGIRKDPFVGQAYISSRDRQKVIAYLARKISSSVRDLVIFINVIEQKTRGMAKEEAAGAEFVISTGPYVAAVSKYAEDRGIYISTNGYAMAALRQIRESLKDFTIFFANAMLSILFKHGRRPAGDARPSIAIFPVVGRNLFDFRKKTSLFWLSDPLIDRNRVVMLFDKKGFQFKRGSKEEIESAGARALITNYAAGYSGGIDRWRPSIEILARLIALNAKTWIALFNSLAAKHRDSVFYIRDITRLNRIYLFWLDLFRRLNVKITLNPPDYDPDVVGRYIAIEEIGGVNINYQMSNYDFPCVEASSCADIHFSFGPYYRQSLERSGLFVDTLLFSGYVTDYVFNELRKESPGHRERLMKNGAEFIVAYFDQNSSDQRMGLRKDSDSADIYRQLFEKVISDDKMGLICKPKESGTFRRVSSGIASLRDSAVKTGRCILLEEGWDAAASYPAEAALASDLAIGIPSAAGTAATEAFLCGIPVLYLDLEESSRHPLREIGKDAPIFDSLSNLLNKVDEIREDRNLRAKFMAMEDRLQGRDPFRDGKAVERMNEYIRSILGYFDMGASRRDAIDNANRLYAEKWGSDKVVRINP